MKKILNFLNKTSEIKNADRLTIVVNTAILMGVGFYLSNKLYETRIENIDKDIKIDDLNRVLEGVKNERDQYKEVIDNLDE